MNSFWRSLWPLDDGGRRHFGFRNINIYEIYKGCGLYKRFGFNNNAKQDDITVVLAVC